MDQELITPEKPPSGTSQAFNPLGCFIAAAGVTLLTLCLLGSASVVAVWAFSKLLGIGEDIAYILMALSIIPPILATIWTGGRAWHVERRMAQHMDIDTPVFKLLHYYKK